MKKLILIISVLLSLTASSQIYQPYNQFGNRFNRTIALFNLGIPRDTIAPPTDYQNYPHIAAKGDTLYIWNTSTLAWQEYSSGGSYTFPYSVVAPGDAIQLENDTTANPANYFYGRNSAGRRGWYPQSGITGVNFYNSDGEFTGSRVVNGGGFDLEMSNVANFTTDVLDQIFFSAAGTSLTLQNSSAIIQSAVGPRISQVVLYPDSIKINPPLGVLKIDTLNYTLSTTGKKILIRDTATGLVENIDPALIGGGGSASVNPIYTGYQNPVIRDTTRYTAFPTAITTDKHDTAYIFATDGVVHAGYDAKLVMFKTIDGGSSYSDMRTIVDSQRNWAVAMGSDNRIVYSYVRQGGTYFHFGYTTDGGNTMTQVDSLPFPAGIDATVPFGKGVRLPSGKILLPAYGYSADSSFSYLWQSSDNGATWSQGPIVKRSLTAGSFPQGSINEMAIEKVNLDAASDGTQKILAVIRNESYPGNHNQAYSSDGGATWTQVTDAWAFGSIVDADFGSTSGNWPASLTNINGVMYAAQGVRGSSGKFSNIVFKAPAENVYNVGNNWNRSNGNYYAQLDVGVAGYKGATVDFGYSSIFPTPTGVPMLASYDNSQRSRVGIDGTTAARRLRVYAIKAYGTYFYQQSSSAQTITTGTLTNVTFGTTRGYGGILLDAYPAYNRDSSRYEFPEDGYYSVDVRVNFDTSSLGTYRYAMAARADLGVELGTDLTTAGQLKGFQMIEDKYIQPSTNANFCTIYLHGRVYAKRGEPLRIKVMHDAGSDLDLINTTQNTRAEVTVIKLN